LKSLLEPAFGNEIRMSGSGGGTYPNLFCAHPPFQIDGNFGGTAGIAEMLIQSQNRYIELLPALPDRWNQGSFKGLRVRGGAEIDAAWDNKKISYAFIKATTSNTFKLKIPEYSLCVKANNRPLKAENGFVVFKLKQGEKMLLSFENR
jgi:alpha-L-fucosidase 2